MVTQHPNRATRRQNAGRFRGNKKGISLTVTEGYKYKRVIQFVPPNITWNYNEKTNNYDAQIISPAKKIEHYLIVK